MRKLGQTTGHNVGEIIDKCVDYTSTGPDRVGRAVVQLCQDRANFVVDRGDSGSPVFNTISCTVEGRSDLCAVV